MLSNRLETSEIPDNLLTLSEFTQLLLRKWRFIAVFTFACMFSTAVVALLIPNQYTAKSTILPASANPGAAGGLLSANDVPMLDMLSLNLGDNSPSVLYPELLKSRILGDEILKKQYSFAENGSKITKDLFQYFDTDNNDQAYANLMEVTNIEYNKKTGIVGVNSTTKVPELSAQIVNQFIESLDGYKKEKWKTGAAQNREFIESRIIEVKSELHLAENNLNKFRNNNLNYYLSTDPDLITEHNRLIRDVELKNQVYITLAQQYEMAIIQEKKENPTIQVLDFARAPSIKSGPMRTKITFVGLLAGLFLSSLLVFLNFRYHPEYELNDIKKYARKLNFIRRKSEKEKIKQDV